MTPAQFPIGGDFSPLPCRARLASFGAANSPAVFSSRRRGFLFGAVAGSVGQQPAAIQTPTGGFGILQTATARTALPANAVASQGAA